MADENRKIDIDEIVDDIKDLNNTHDHTSHYGSQEIDEGKLMAVLSYLGILVLIPLFATKNAFARFHTNQGLVLAIIEIVWSFVFGLVDKLVGGIILVGWLVGIVGWLVSAVFLVVSVIGIINAVNGRAKDLPVIGKVRILK